LRFPRSLPVIVTPESNVPSPSIPIEYANPGLSLQQLYSIFWAYRKQTLIIFATITLITAVVAKLLPKTYSSTAILVVNFEVNDPSAGKELPIGLLGSYISTQTELLRSRTVLQPVIDKLNLLESKKYASGFAGDSEGLRNWVEKNLSADLEIGQAANGSQLINITAFSTDPVSAAEIANAIVDVYLPLHRSNVAGPATERAQRYAEQLAELKAKVAAAQQNVSDFRQSTGMVDANADMNVEGTMLTNLEQEHLIAQNAQRSAEVKNAENKATSSQILNSNRIQTLKGELSRLEMQYAQLSSTLGPQHPQMIELQSEIASAKRAVNDEVASYASTASTDLQSAQQLEIKLRNAVEKQRAKVIALRKRQDEGTKYVLELESAQTVYKRALDGYDQILSAAGSQYSNINVFSRAVPAIKATKPNKIKLLAMGMMVGVFFGLAFPFAFELFNRRIRCRDDLEREFNIPVLMEFDAIPMAGQA
jgi:polysaccharide biosynthesis transport protein